MLVEIEELVGIGTTGVVVDCVVVELDDELCAKAEPHDSATHIVAANKTLIILITPGTLVRGTLAQGTLVRAVFVLILWLAPCTADRLGKYSPSHLSPTRTGSRWVAARRDRPWITTLPTMEAVLSFQC